MSVASRALPDPAVVARRLQRGSPVRPRLAFELGSGFGGVGTALEISRSWEFSELAGFPPVGVAGHDGRLLVGDWQGVPVAVLSGRAHFYEGHDMSTLTFPIRVLAAWGVETVVLTNAAGAIRPGFRPGDFMVLRDHLNFMGANPLRGPEVPGRSRFVDLTETYDADGRRLMTAAARALKVRLHSGVYLAVSGPSYETPAEIRMFRRWGADAVGMSTVPGAVVARQCGLRVVGLSCLTNAAAGLAPSGQGIDHVRDVLEPAQARTAQATALLGEFVRRWSAKNPGPQNPGPR